MINLTNFPIIDKHIIALNKILPALDDFDESAKLDDRSLGQIMAPEESRRLKRYIERDAKLLGIKNPLQQSANKKKESISTERIQSVSIPKQKSRMSSEILDKAKTLQRSVTFALKPNPPKTDYLMDNYNSV